MKVHRIDTFTRGPVSLVRVTTDAGRDGIGQIAPYNADIAATVLQGRPLPPLIVLCVA